MKENNVIKNSDMPIWKSLLLMVCCIVPIILFVKFFISITFDDNPYKNNPSYSNGSSYSNSHRCEYPGCNNYASGSQYCSKHNQTKCSKPGCNNIEAYQGAGLCRNHLYNSVKNY